MTVVRGAHEAHGASFEAVGDGRELPSDYGRPERTARALRNGVGVTEAAYGVLEVTGEDRVGYVDNVLTNRVPDADGAGCYALLLDPQGKVRADVTVYNAGERLLLFFPPGVVGGIAEEWREKVFIQDVSMRVATDDFAVFGVHGPKATEKIASVLSGVSTPDEPHTFVRGNVGDAGANVVRTDAPLGEESYEVVCAAAEADTAFESLLYHGLNAVPFGRRTWRELTLEAGTPLFESEMAGEIPNVLGLRNALDFEKGCYVGQEVVSRVENVGQPSRRLVGLEPAELPDSGAAVFEGESAVGEVTRAVRSPTLDRPLALALVAFDAPADLSVRVGGDEAPAPRSDLPFVEGSARSARLPTY
jgi:aminomethyltransferase